MDQKAIAIEFVKVSKFYGPTCALREFSLQLPAGQLWAITGNNGSGKSTVARIAGGVIRPDQGCVNVLGCHPDRASLPSSLQISYLPQGVSFSKALTARDIVSFAAYRKKIDIPSVDQVLARMGIAAAADWLVGLLPHHIVKRLALALAFMGDPRLLILDEPTECLDREGRVMLERILESRHEDQSVLMMTPLLGTLEHVVDTVVELDNGETTATRRLLHGGVSLLPSFRIAVEGSENESAGEVELTAPVRAASD